MIDNLRNHTILIGREDGPNRRLHIALRIDGQVKSAMFGDPGSVPDSVSRCKPTEDVGHCKLEISSSGTIICTNLKSQNRTYVDNIDIDSKRVYPETKISLGRDKYSIPCESILKIANKLVEIEKKKQDAKKEYSIAPLKRVWAEYHDQLFALQKKQKHQGIIKSLYLPCTFLSGGVGVLASNIGLDGSISQPLSTVMYVLSAFFLFYGLYMSFSDKSLEQREQITERFQEKYVCPNPNCRHFMGNTPYKILKQNTNCPYCKCKFKAE